MGVMGLLNEVNHRATSSIIRDSRPALISIFRVSLTVFIVVVDTTGESKLPWSNHHLPKCLFVVLIDMATSQRGSGR